ncbi:MAG: hypothetical protein ACOH1T_03850 [Microbacteriaceae bacterium]
MSEINETQPDPTEIVIEEKRRVNGTGLTALIIVIVSFIAPIVIAIVGVNAARDSSRTTGEFILATVIVLATAAVAAIAVDVVGIVVGVVALFRKNRGRVLAFSAIILGIVPAIFVVLGATFFSNFVSMLGQG